MDKHHKTKYGFTLIETIAVVAIIGILSVILVVNWRENEKNYLVQQVAQEIVQSIRKTQGMALSGKQIDGEMPDSYGVYFKKTLSPNSFIIFGDINNDKKYQSSDTLIETITIDSQIQIYDISTSGNQDLSIFFSIPDGFTSFDPSADSATIYIKRIGTTCPSKTCRSIIIKDTGQITIQ